MKNFRQKFSISTLMLFLTTLFLGNGQGDTTKTVEFRRYFNSTLLSHTKSLSRLSLVVMVNLLFCGFMVGQITFTNGNFNSNWSDPLNWSPMTVPSSTDDVIIPDGYTVNIDLNAECKSLTFNTGTFPITLNVNSPYSLLVTQNMILNHPIPGSGSFGNTINLVSGSITCANISMSDPGDNSRRIDIIINSGTLNVSGNITMNAPASRNAIRFTGAGTLNLGGSISGGDIVPGSTSTINYNGTASQTVAINADYVYHNLNINNTAGATLQNNVTSTNVTGSLSVQSGNFNNGGFAINLNTQAFSVSNGATFNISGTSGMVTGTSSKTFGATSTVNYTGSNQTVSDESYGNLGLSGTGEKTFDADIAIANNLSISNTTKALLDIATTSTTGSMTLNGNGTAMGFHGSTNSAATYKNDTYFVSANTGTIEVLTGTCGAYNAALTGDNTICLGGNSNLVVNISGGGVSPYTVVYSAGTESSYTSGANINVSPGATTMYTLTSVTDAVGCTASVSGMATVTVLPNAEVTSVSGISSLCIGATATYTAGGVVLGGGTGAWSSSDPLVASINSTTGEVTALTAGTTNIIFTITGGCNGTPSAQQSLTVLPNAAVTSVTGTSPLCIGAMATYTASGVVLSGGTGAWSSSNPSVASVDPATGVVTALSIGTTNIIFTITGGCNGTPSAQQSFTVSPVGPTALTYTTSTNIYTEGTVITPNTVATITGTPPFVYTVTSLPPGLSINSATGTISGTPTAPTNSHTYTVTASNSCGSTSTTLTITINAIPFAGGACTLLNNNFSTNPQLANTNVNGAWYPDRYRPAGFTSNGSQLKISINANDGAQLRPAGLTGGFYNTQGRKINQCGGCVTIAKADLYIPADWATNKRRSDLWATAFNNSNAVSAYPIIGFRNVTGSNPKLSVWNIVGAGGWIEIAEPAAYNTSYTLEIRLNGSNLEYLIDNAVVATYPSGGSVYFGDVMLQAFNFNDNTLGVFYDAGPNNSYDALWDNLVTTSGTGNVVTNTANGNTYCSIQSAIDDAQTLNGHTLAVQPGTYNEQVIVNKELTIKSATATKAIINFTGTVTGKPTLIDVTANNVTIENLQFNVDLSKLKSAIIASSAGLDNIIIKDNMIGAYATPSSGTYGDRNAVSINYGGNTNYRVATGGVNSVSFTGNTVTGTAPDSYFRSAISVDEAGLTATGNTLTTINHDVLLRFASNGANLISGNTFNGGGLELSDQNAGSGTITVSSNNFNGVGAPNTAVLRVKNNNFGVTHSIFSNTFTGFDWAVSLENMNLVTLNGNTFNGDAATDRHIVVNTKSISSNSNTIVQVPIAATMTNNAFNGMGIGLTFQNHDSDNDSYIAFTIGSAGNANTFAAGLSTFIQLDAQTGISNGSTFPTYPNTGGWPTTMDCWATNLNVQNNTFDVGAGQQAPQAMSAAERTTLEGKLTHNPDVACLGTLQYFLPVKNVTQTTFYSTIQSAINASAAMDVIELAEWTFNERVVIDKSLTLQGVDSANVVITGAGLLGNGKGIQINNGVTNVTIKKLTVQNFSGSSGNADAGIYAIGGNNNLVIEQVAIVNNVGGSGFYANGPVNGVSITNVTSTGHTVGARGIVIWNGLKENINISNCHVYGNNCCGIELQDGTASGVTMNNNNVHDNGDNGLGLTGMQGPIANVISNNTITNNGRFGIEIKNPDGNGASSGAGSIVVSGNTVSLTNPIVDARDIAGIAIMRRGVLAGNTDVPTGIYVTGNTVTGYTQPSNSDGFGIVVAGTNHTVTGNTVSGNDVGIQQQAGHLPYPGDGLQDNLIDEYFGRDNTPFTCGNSITANSPNTTRNVGIIGGDGFVVNTNTGRTFCSIQSAINHTTTLSTHVLEVSDGTFSENITVSKSLTINGANSGINANSSSDITMINGTRIPESILSATNIQVTAQNVTIDGFMFSGAGGIHTNGVSANVANGLTIVNNVFDNVPTSAYNNNSGAAVQSNLVFSNNRVVGNNTATISAANPWYISDMTMNANYFAGYERGVQLDNNSNLTISNSYFTNITHQGLQVANSCSTINITANVFNNCNTMTEPDRGAIRLYHNVTGNINILNNIFTNNYNAVRVRSASPFTHSFFNVNNNTFTFNTKAISDGTTGSTGFVNGTCNWFGTINANTIQSLLEGNVNYVSYLTSGNDANTNIGFQPDGMCNGTPVIITDITSTPDLCGPSDGTISVTFEGGTPTMANEYEVSWSGPVSGGPVIATSTYTTTPLPAGVYTVTVTDTNGSTATSTVTIQYLPITLSGVTPTTYFATIQEAIAASQNGDIVDVCDGTHSLSSHSSINTDITLQGHGRDNTIVEMSSSWFNVNPSIALTLNAPGITVKDIHFKVVGAGAEGSILGVFQSNTQILNNKFSGTYAPPSGLVTRATVWSASPVTGILMDNNIIESLRQPGYLSGGSGDISNNTIMNTRGWVIESAQALNITENKFGANTSHFTILAGANVSDLQINENDMSGVVADWAIDNRAPNLSFDASCNWWGTPIVNIIQTKISGNVDFDAWLILDMGGSSYSWSGGDEYSCDGTPVVITSANSTPNQFCQNDGTIAVNFSGGTMPYTVSWTGPTMGGPIAYVSGNPLGGFTNGTYILTVSDINGSTASTMVSVGNLPVRNTTTTTYYGTIQAAISAAASGNIIDVCAGTYNENVVVDKALTIQGSNSNRALQILDGTGIAAGSNGFTINSNITGVTIKNFTIQNFIGTGGNSAGIKGVMSNSNLLINNVDVKNNTNSAGIHLAAISGINNVTITNSSSSNHGPGARGIVIWDGLKTNINISGNTVTNNNCCGIELQDGDASAVTISGNTINIGNGDNALGLTGLNNSVGMNMITTNTIIGGGRYGIEIKNPNGGVVVSGNNVNMAGPNLLSLPNLNKDRAGIAVFRRGVLYNNIDVPTGVTITGNTVTGVQQGSSSEGFGIVIEGTNHSVTGNTVSGCDVGIQQQQNPSNYPGNADDIDVVDQYFGRGNSPITCGNIISGNTLSNSIDTRNVGSLGGDGFVSNPTSGETFCSIKSAINDPQTLDGHTLNISAGTFNIAINGDPVLGENVIVSKDLTINGASPSTTILTPTVACAGTGITISANNATVQNLKVTNFSNGLAVSSTGVLINNVESVSNCNTGLELSSGTTNLSVQNSKLNNNTSTGFRKGTAAIVSGFTLNNSEVKGNVQGCFVAKNNGAGGTFDNVTITNSDFSNNTQKGMYFEALSNAMIDGVTMNASGIDPAYNNNAGIDINLKYGAYTNITIQNSDITNSGVYGTATDVEQTAAVMIKARDDSPSYNTVPASLSSVLIKNNKITGPQNGIRFGEFGKINAGPSNVTLEGNDISHAFANKAVIRRTNNSINLVCNWHGTTSLPTIWGTFSQVGSGSINLNSVLGIGTDPNPTVGFQPSGSCTCPSGNLVTNTNTSETFCTIQAAIDDAQTLGTHTLTVGPGTYVENIVVNKSLTINGPNAAIDPCSGTRVTEAIVTTAVQDWANGAVVFYIAANTSNVTISGFTIDGDNVALTSGVIGTNLADIDAAEAISTYETGVNGLRVTNNIIQNFAYFGVTLYDYPAGLPSSGHLISNNKIQNLGTYTATGPAAWTNFWGGGVLLYNNQYAAVTNNCMTNVRFGLQTGNFYQANPGSSTYQNISNNSIEARRRGVFHNLAYSTASALTLSNNVITALDNSNETVWDGILLASLSVPSTTSGNIINGLGSTKPSEGIEIWNVKSTSPALISGGSISNVNTGIFANNYEGYNSVGADGAHATVTGPMTITPNVTGIGVRLLDSPSSTIHAKVNATITGVTISGGLEGIKLEQTATGAVGGSFTGNTISAAAAGINVTKAALSVTNPLTISGNSVTVTNQVISMTPTAGILLTNITSLTTAATVSNNIITGPLYGYVGYNINTAPVTNITGGTISGVMQGAAFVNTTGGPIEPSTVGISGVSMSGFAGTSPSAANNFHAGIYTFTTATTTPAQGITLNVDGVTINGTGVPSQSSGGISLADFSGGAVNVQTVTVNNSTIINNSNRGVDARGKVNLTLTNSTLSDNGHTAFGSGGNDGFTIIAQQGATVNATNNFITHPSSSTTPVTAFLTGTGPASTIIAHNNSVLMNGNVTNGRRASNVAGSTINATCNWWGTDACPTDLTTGVVSVYPYITNGTDNDVATGFQPVPNSCSEPAIKSTVTSPVGPYNVMMTSGNSYSHTICSGQLITTSPVSVVNAEADNCSSLRVRTVYTTTLSTLPPTQTFDQAYSVASLLPPTSITPENHDGVAKNIVFVSTPYYDVNGNNQYDMGIDAAGGLVTFTLTVLPRPNISNTVTSGVYSQVMVSGGSYTRAQCHNTDITTSVPTLISSLENSCGNLRIRTEYISTLPNIPSAVLDNTFTDVVAAGPQTISPNNTTGSTQTITFLTTPYYELDGVPGLTAGDIVGGLTTFVLTVHPIPAGGITGTSYVIQNSPVTANVTFTGTVGTPPFTFTYSLDGGSPQTISTLNANNAVTLPHPNSTPGVFVYTLLSVTDANGCPGVLNPGETIVTITVISVNSLPDLAPSIARPLNASFTYGPPGQSKEGYVQFTNGGTGPTYGNTVVRISKPAGFNITLDNSISMSAGAAVINNQIGVIIDSSNPSYWQITYPNAINNGTNIKVGFIIQANAFSGSKATMTATVINNTGGDSNDTNNKSIRTFVIN